MTRLINKDEVHDLTIQRSLSHFDQLGRYQKLSDSLHAVDKTAI